MNRLSLLTSAVAVAMLMGCASASEPQDDQDQTESSASALKVDCEGDEDPDCECDGPGKKTFTVRSVQNNTLTLVRANGAVVTATFTTATKFKLANLNRFQPQDPVRPALINYNTRVSTGTEILGTLEDVTSFAVRVRVGIKADGTIRAFRPVPVR